MSKPPLPDAEVKAFLDRHPGWSKDEKGMLVRTFEARTFLEGIAFVDKVAKVAEALDHHPDIDIRWRKVTLRLITHDAGNRLTELDTRVAADASKLFESHP
ncbi:MAG: 4a-hydroxytetrahydrobiopterin dehydratase [Myxococcaceae bacterium]